MCDQDTIAATLMDAEKEGRLIDTLVSVELNAEGTDVEDVLGELQNRGGIDLTSAVNLAAIHALGQSQFWDVFHPLYKAISALRCEYLEILALVNALVTKAGNDGAAGMPNIALVEWSKNNAPEAEKIVDGLKQGDRLCLEHGLFAVIGLGDESVCFDLIQSSNSNERTIGFRALGRLETIEVESIKKGVDASHEIIDKETDKHLRHASIEAAFRLWEKLGQSHPYRQIEFVERIGRQSNLDELTALSGALFHHNAGLPRHTINTVLDWLATTQSNSDATLQNLDHAITLGDERWEFEQIASVFVYCIPSLNNQPDDRSYHGFRDMVWSDPANASYLFSQWLSGGQFGPCSFLSQLAASSGEDLQVPILKRHLPADEAIQKFMANKSIGFFWHHEVTAASILLSIVKNGKATARRLAEELLFDPLLLSYGGRLRDYLETQRNSKSKRVADCVARILAKHDEHLAGIDSAKGLIELRPSIEQRRTAAVKDQERRRDIEKGAHERSILSSLVTHETLLYGKKSLSIMRDGDGTKHPSIMELSEFSHSIEVPRLSVFDPVGFSEMITVFRAMKRKSE